MYLVSFFFQISFQDSILQKILPYSNLWSVFWIFLKFVWPMYFNRFSLLPISSLVPLFIIELSITAECYGSIGFCQFLVKTLFICCFIITQITASRTWKKLMNRKVLQILLKSKIKDVTSWKWGWWTPSTLASYHFWPIDTFLYVDQ